jgi:hypothetical protein
MNSSAMQRPARGRSRPAMMVSPDCFVLTYWDGSQAGFMYSANSLEEVVIVPCGWPRKAGAAGVASPWRNSVRSSCAPTPGTPSHARRGKLALMKLISIRTLSLKIARKKDNEATAALTGAPG